MHTSTRGGFGALWTSAGAANLADGIALAGLPVLATTVTDSPGQIAGVTFALMLPLVLTALPAGVIADRYDRRGVIVGGNVWRATGLGVLLLAVLGVDLRIVTVYAAAMVVGSGEMVVDTTTKTAVPSLVARDGLERANARLGGTQVVMNDAIGAPVGALLAAASATLVLGTAAGLYALAALAVLRLRAPAPRRGASDGRDDAGSGPFAEVREGLAELRRHLVLGRIAAVAAASNLGNTAFFSVFVVFVVGPLGLPAAAYGVFLAAVAVGGLLGSVVARRLLQHVGHARVLKVGFMLAALVYGLVAVTSSAVAVAVGAAVLGGMGMILNISSNVLKQRLAPPHLLGRVTASVSVVALIATPVGVALGGLVAEVAGVRWVGALAVAANLAGVALLRPVTERRIAQGAPAVSGVEPQSLA